MTQVIPVYDSAMWREERDRLMAEWVGDESAVKFLVLFFDACEFFDDVHDGDELEHGHFTRVLFGVLTEIPANTFFDRWKGQLIPVMIAGINAWLDANVLEGGGKHDRISSYALRDWYLEIVNVVIYLTRGRDVMRELSMDVRRFFTQHETLEQYMDKLS